MNEIEKFGYYVAQYLDDVKHSNKSMQTVNNYAKAFKQFTEYWREYGDINEEPRTPLFRAWRNYMDDKGLKVSTIKAYLMALHIFFSYYEDEEDADGELVYGGCNPVSKKLYPKQEKRPYDVILSDENVAKLWANIPPTHRQKAFWARNYAIVTLLLTSKIRNAELLNLRYKDINLDDKYLVVERGKGGYFRIVDIPDIAVYALKIYLASSLYPTGLKDDDYLFGTMADESGLGKTNIWHKGTSQWLSSLVERSVFSVTGVHDVRSHDLRHIGARIDLQMGLSKEQIQQALGHHSISITERYSGDLEARMGRESAQKIFAARDYWTNKNKEMVDQIYGLSKTI